MPEDRFAPSDQHGRFKELAKELGCEDDPVAFEEALKKLSERKPPKHQPKKRKPRSDSET